MEAEKQKTRLSALASEFRALIEFHATSFNDIDDKGRYWLTITLPSFLALFGYLISEFDSLAAPILTAGYALATCLAVATYFFSCVLLSERVESGILVPPDKKFSSLKEVIDNDDQWNKLSEMQAAQLLSAIQINEAANARKSDKLSKAEWSLFRAAPAATVLAASIAFAYTASCPVTGSAAAGLSARAIGTTAATGLGIIAGIVVTAAFIGVRHYRLASRKKSTDSNRQTFNLQQLVRKHYTCAH